MGEVINLREARKRKARAEKETEAARNRRRHGLPKSEKRLLEAEREKRARDLEDKRRDGDTAEDDAAEGDVGGGFDPNDGAA